MLAHKLGAALALAAALSANLGSATSTVPLTLNEQAKRADVIVRATIGTPTNAKEGDVSYTVYPLSILETIAGDIKNLPQSCDKPALYFLQGTLDLPQIGSGQEAFLLLYTKKMDSGLVGFNQGFYPVNNGSVAVGELTDPAKLRDALRAARESK